MPIDGLVIAGCGDIVDILSVMSIGCDDDIAAAMEMPELPPGITLRNMCCSTCYADSTCSDMDDFVATLGASMATMMNEMIPGLEVNSCSSLVDIIDVLGIGCTEDLSTIALFAEAGLPSGIKVENTVRIHFIL